MLVVSDDFMYRLLVKADRDLNCIIRCEKQSVIQEIFRSTIQMKLPVFNGRTTQMVPFQVRSQSMTTLEFVMSVHPFVRMEQLGSHWVNFREIVCWGFLLKSVHQNQVC
jgi:hypothetical protein